MAVTRRDLAAVGLWAAGTAGVILAALGPSALQATDPPGSRVLVAAIEEPALLDNGVKLTVRPIEQTTARGTKGRARAGFQRRSDEPDYEVRAENTTNKPVTAYWAERLTVSAPPSAGARAMPLPMIVWKERGVVELAAREVRSIRVSPGVRARAGASVYFQLYAASDWVTVDSFVAATPGRGTAGAGTPTTAPPVADASMSGFMPFVPATQPSAVAVDR